MQTSPIHPRRRILKLSVFTVAAALIVIVVLMTLCYRQAYSLAHPVCPHVARSLTEFGISSGQGVSFTSLDGTRLDGWYIPPAPDSDGAALLMLSGHGGTRINFVNEARILIREGYGLLMYDTRGCGTSGGSASTMGLLETEDAQAAFAFLASLPEVDPNRIGIYGQSMGATIAIRAMARIPQARVLIADAAYESLESVIADGVTRNYGLPSFPFAQIVVWLTGQQSGTNLFDVRPIDDISSISPRPIFFLHGTNDPVIPVWHSERLYAAAGEPKELYLVEGGGHNGLLGMNPTEYERRLLPFLATYLHGE